jgi:hypothetical protein
VPVDEKSLKEMITKKKFISNLPLKMYLDEYLKSRRQ